MTYGPRFEKILKNLAQRLRRIAAPPIDAARSLWRSVRRRKIIAHVIPAQHLEQTASGAWIANDNDPIFELNVRDGRFPTQWVRVQIGLQVTDNLPVNSSFYTRSRPGDSARERFTLPVPVKGRIKAVMRLPERVTAMRFDPMERPGRFELGRIEFREIGRIEAGLLIAMQIFRQRDGRAGDFLALLRRAHELYATGGLALLKSRLLGKSRNVADYEQWIAQHEVYTAGVVDALNRRAASFTIKPKFSVIMPVYNTSERWLDRAISSVREQIYPNWELCIADDCSTKPHVRKMLEFHAARDSRVRVVYRPTNGHIAAATNSAMAIAAGDHLCLMDHDDEMAPNALYEFAAALNEDSDLDFIYSDEDKITPEGRRHGPFFKPDWSPEYLESCMYPSHLICLRRDIVDKIGGFRTEFDGAQDFDFMLRCAEHLRKPKHIRKILYHWRTIPGSTARSMTAKDYAVDAGVRALQDRLKRTGSAGQVRGNFYKGCFDVRRDVRGSPLVSIVIPSAGRDGDIRGAMTDLLVNCVDSVVSKSSYRNFEFIIVNNHDLRGASVDRISRLCSAAGKQVKFARYSATSFNFSAQMNFGVAQASGEFIILLNDDIEVISPDWIEAMLGLGQQQDIGAVGAKLRFENGSLQHVGVAFCEGVPDHIRRGYPADDPGYFFSSVAQKNYLAITGACLLMRKSLFDDVGGLDEQFPVNYNDIDLCLKLHERGLRIALTPLAELYHFESQSRARMVAHSEQRYFLQRWGHLTKDDPYYPEQFDAYPPNFAFLR